MTTGLLVTTIGRQKLIAFAAGGPAVTISHIAVGDANGVPYMPAEGQTALVNERYRMPVSSLGITNEPAVNVEAIFPADTNDAQGRPSHGFNVHELGVFDSTGALIAVARMGGGFKPSPAVNGQAASRVLIAKLFASNVNSIVATIDATTWVHIGRLHGLYFLAHGGVLNAPPISPAVGAFYIVGSAPTGAFAGQAGKVTQWTGAMWVFKDAPVGLEVVDQSISDLANPAKILRRNQAGTAWENATASATAYGRTIFATPAEVLAGVATNKAVDPAALASGNRGGGLAVTRNAAFNIPVNTFTTMPFDATVTASEHITWSGGQGTVVNGGWFGLAAGIGGTALNNSGLPMPGQKVLEIRRTRSGSPLSRRVVDAAADAWGVFGSAYLALQAGDVVDLLVFFSAGATVAVGSSQRVYLDAVRVAPL